MVRDGQSYYYQTNSHGDVLTVTDSNGHLVDSYSYDPWGKVISPPEKSETIENPIRYAGYYYDSETGLYYLMARYYSPNIARFLTKDSIDNSLLKDPSSLKDPSNLNLYMYCGNNPVMNIDPLGLWKWLSDAWNWACRNKSLIAGVAGGFLTLGGIIASNPIIAGAGLLCSGYSAYTTIYETGKLHDINVINDDEYRADLALQIILPFTAGIGDIFGQPAYRMYLDDLKKSPAYQRYLKSKCK